MIALWLSSLKCFVAHTVSPAMSSGAGMAKVFDWYIGGCQLHSQR